MGDWTLAQQARTPGSGCGVRALGCQTWVSSLVRPTPVCPSDGACSVVVPRGSGWSPVFPLAVPPWRLAGGAWGDDRT